MRWHVTIPGQPPSVNDSYKIVRKYGRRGSYMSLAKRPDVEAYQQAAALIIRTAMPKSWKPTGQVLVRFSFFLVKDIDCDNALKSIDDAIEMATGINDSRYLPCVLSKEIGVSPAEARVEITIGGRVSPLRAPVT